MSLFQEIKGTPNAEQIQQIAKTGIVPSELKGPEDKVYTVIFRSYLVILQSEMSETSIDGEAIIVEGRHKVFMRIKEFLENEYTMSVDIRTSTVMVEGVDAGKAVSLYRFIKLCNNAYPDEAIPEEILDKYLEGFTDEEEVKKQPAATGFGGNAGTLLNREEN